jgi:hypothetical protein
MHYALNARAQKYNALAARYQKALWGQIWTVAGLSGRGSSRVGPGCIAGRACLAASGPLKATCTDHWAACCPGALDLLPMQLCLATGDLCCEAAQFVLPDFARGHAGQVVNEL